MHFLVLLLLAALAIAQPCPPNPVIAITETNEQTCSEGNAAVRGNLRVDFDAILGSNRSNMVLINGALVTSIKHVQTLIINGIYNMTAAELFEGFTYAGNSVWGAELWLPNVTDIETYMLSHGIVASPGLFLPKIHVGLAWTSTGDLKISTQDATPVDRFGPALCPIPDTPSASYSVCVITYLISVPTVSGGAYMVDAVEGPVDLVDAPRSKIFGGSLNSITASARAATVGGYANTVPSGMDDAVIMGGSGLTARGPGAMTSDMYVEGVLYSDDVTAVAGDLTAAAQNDSKHVIVKLGHTWDNYPETYAGQFEVRDSNNNPAFVVNNWGTTVIKQGTMLEGAFRDIASDNGTSPLTAGRVALGYTFYRKVPGASAFIVELPPAVEFEALLGTAGTATPLGVRFPPIIIINRSATYTVGFQLPGTVSAVWAPSTPFTACPVSSMCKLELTTVGSSAGTLTFLIQVDTLSVS